MTNPAVSRIPHPRYTEHRVARDAGSVRVREYEGKGPAFVPLHGFPDNLHIFDDLVPLLVAAGRKVASFDFLGYGDSDKPAGQHYSFAQQLGDLEAVVKGLNLDKIVPVSHDSAGPTAINFALNHPEMTSGLVILNSVYSTSNDLDHPEFIELFARPEIRNLTRAFLQRPEIFRFIMHFQREIFQKELSEEHRAYYMSFLGPIIDHNFSQQPSALPAFGQMVSGLLAEEEHNLRRIPELAKLDIPVRIIWGDRDPYLRTSYAEYLRGKFARAELHVVDAGHWVQLDEAPTVAKIMLTL
ncbi:MULTISPECIES: alpha/beta hydrolase [unclassified Afipia]|uniref:alpha/beta fold hydrolase n=1 Tax=unclassified Afipia TaxID=2642050 RepID=UPI001360B299|nr:MULTISPECIES: alpha/beta hydrolase [unclassified Afipia]